MKSPTSLVNNRARTLSDRLTVIIHTLICLTPLMAGVRTHLSAQALLAVPPLSFEVASIRENISDSQSSVNVPLTANSLYPPNGGKFSAHNIPLVHFIGFAYKLDSDQETALTASGPSWMSEKRFDIEARTPVEPTKDQMRMMMQNLLEIRFKLSTHSEAREMQVLALVLNKPGRLGPALKPYVASPSCPADAELGNVRPNTPSAASGLQMPQPSSPEARCLGFAIRPPAHPGARRIAGSATIDELAGTLEGLGRLGHRVVNHTGLQGIYTFELEWFPTRDYQRADEADAAQGPSFLEALSDDLGMKLKTDHEPVQTVLIDHIEQLSPN